MSESISVNTGCGIALLNSDGVVFLCDAEFRFITDHDITGMHWSDLTSSILKLSDTTLVSLFEPLYLSDFRRTLSLSATLNTRREPDISFQLSLHPVWDPETENLVQVILTLLSGSGQTPSQTIAGSNADEWEKTFNAMTDPVTLQDRDMRIVKANSAAYEMFGVDMPNSLLGRKCYEVFQNLDTPCTGCPVTQTAQDCAIHSGLVYNSRLEKTFDIRSSPIYDDDGVLHLIVQIARDVTLNLQQEAERRLLSAAIEQASESVMITDCNGCLLYVNPAFCQTTGYSKEEAIGKNTDILKSGVHDQKFYLEMWGRLQAGRSWRGRLTNRKKNGTFFKEDATISPLINSSGEITNYIALKRDITREESLERQLHQAMKMEAIGTLAGGIAHDFNNILSAIIGYCHIAKYKLQKDNPVQEDLDQILAGGDRAVDLVKQILTFARQESRQQLRLLKVQYIIKEVLKLLRSSLPSTIKIKQEIDEDCLGIMADPSQIHQLLMNLCTNARQAIGDEHGEIVITLTQHEAKEVRAIGGETHSPPGKYLQLSVADSGCGMDRTMLERIFDPFYTTREKEHGTGLGLAVVHGIVKKHHGEIHVDSEIGKGTTFHMFFSVPEDELETTRERVAQVVHGNERIMLVDDEIAVSIVHEKILTKLGYVVSRFTDSLEAMEAFRKDPGCCDLVITDMTMPSLTGKELAIQLLSIRPELPIILVTGYSEAVDKEKAMEIGIRDFLLKPLRKENISSAIRNVLNKGKHSE